MQTNRRSLLLLYAAICAHKVFTAMSLSTRFLRKGISIGLLTVLLLPFHLLPPLAVILAAAVGSDNALASLIMVSLATGTFLYVGAFEVVCEEFAEHGHGDAHAKAQQPSQLHSADMQGEQTDGQMVMSGDWKGKESNEWVPSKAVKFGMYLFGTALLLGITAALPKHVH